MLRSSFQFPSDSKNNIARQSLAARRLRCAFAACAACATFLLKKTGSHLHPEKQAQKTQHQACSVTGGRDLSSQHWLLQQRCQSARCYDLEKLSSEDWEALLVRGARVGSTSEEGGKSLNHPITMLDRSSSSNSICTAPMNDLWSIRP